MTKDSVTLDSLTERLVEFRDARNWQQFHSLKDLILSLNLEASEMLELAQWKKDDEFEKSITDSGKDPAPKMALEEECADVLLYLLLIAEKSEIDLLKAASAKIDKNAEKYPVEKARGNARKYTELYGEA